MNFDKRLVILNRNRRLSARRRRVFVLAALVWGAILYLIRRYLGFEVMALVGTASVLAGLSEVICIVNEMRRNGRW